MSEQLIATPATFGENGNFLLERELGSGGMGGVYMGRDKMLDRPVAVKVMQKQYGADAEFVEKFKREAQSAARLIHPNIAQIYSYGIADGMPYIAMELVAGGSLWTLMQSGGGKTDVTRVLKICQQVAQALRCATDYGCVHGDIKPENILLDANGNAKLVDFGLAGMQKDTSEIWGTPYYIAPEKVQQQVVDFRSDMYNLGGTLYHALTGRPPFDGEDVPAVVKARFLAPPKKPSELRPDLSPQVDALVLRMLETDKDKRFPSFEALLEEFKQVLTVGLETKRMERPDVASPGSAASGGEAADSDAAPAKRPTKLRTVRRPKRPTSVAAVPELPPDEDPDRGASLGFKVAGVIIGVILLIGGIAGGLVWYKKSADSSRIERHQGEVQAKIQEARKSVAAVRQQAQEFEAEFTEYTEKAFKTCRQTADELKRILPEYAEELEPKVAGTNATDKAGSKGKAETSKAEQPADSKGRPPVLDDMAELWKRGLQCQACAQRISAGVAKLKSACDEADQVSGNDVAAMEKLAGISRQVADFLSTLKTSKDVEDARKASGYIKQKGTQLITQTANRLRVEKLEKERKEQKERAEAEEQARQAAAAAAKAALIESETAAARSKFDSIVAQNVFRQLDWKGARRQLETVKAELKTPEGGFAADNELAKVQFMQTVQDIITENMPGYVFSRGKLRGSKVKHSDEMMITMLRPDGKTPQRISWVKFYQEYRGNLVEMINTFVVRGRENGKRKLSLKEWAGAMCGAALTMRIICSDDAAAVTRGEELVKQVAAAFPDYVKTLKAMFPDIELSAAPAE